MARKMEVPLPELDLWGLCPVQKSVLSDIEMEQRPNTTISWSSTLEFDFTLGEDEYMLFSESYLYLKIKPTFVKADKSQFTDAADAKLFVPANYLLHSMIDKITITIGSTVNTIQDHKYAFKAYLEALLGYSGDARESHLSSSLWMDDEEARSKKLFNPDDNTPRVFELKGKLHVDFTHQNRAIIGGTRMRISISLNKPKFFMKFARSAECKFELLDAVLTVHRMQVSPNVVSAHSKAIAHSNAKYPMTRTAIFYQNIPANSQNIHLDKILSGKTPRRIFFALVTTKAFTGDQAHSPFKFGHHDLSYIVCYKDGQMFPRNGYSMDYSAGLYVNAFVGFTQTLNQNGTDSYANIDMTEYAVDKCIYGFNLCPDLSNGPGLIGHVSEVGESNIRFDLRFSDPTTEALTAVIFAEYDTTFEITKDRQLINPLVL